EHLPENACFRCSINEIARLATCPPLFHGPSRHRRAPTRPGARHCAKRRKLLIRKRIPTQKGAESVALVARIPEIWLFHPDCAGAMLVSPAHQRRTNTTP